MANVLEPWAGEERPVVVRRVCDPEQRQVRASVESRVGLGRQRNLSTRVVRFRRPDFTQVVKLLAVGMDQRYRQAAHVEALAAYRRHRPVSRKTITGLACLGLRRQLRKLYHLAPSRFGSHGAGSSSRLQRDTIRSLVRQLNIVGFAERLKTLASDRRRCGVVVLS